MASSSPAASISPRMLPPMCSTRSICQAVLPLAPARAIESAVAMLSGESARLPGCARVTPYRSSAKALMLCAWSGSAASTSRTGAAVSPGTCPSAAKGSLPLAGLLPGRQCAAGARSSMKGSPALTLT